MGTLLEFIEMQEKSHSKLGVKNLHKLKRVHGSEFNPAEFEFQLKTVLRLIDSTKPKGLTISVDPEYNKIQKLEFKPTISRPNFIFKNRFDKLFSGWYNPVVYVPQANSASVLSPDFLFFRGEVDCMYNLDSKFRKELYSYEFLSNQMLKELSIKLLARMKPVHLVVFARRKFLESDISEIKSAQFYLRPNKVLVMSEAGLPSRLKMNLPVNAEFIERIDLNYQKIEGKNLFY